MRTQLQAARDGIITDQMREVATYEGVDVNHLLKLVAERKVVIPYNPINPPERVRAIGKDMRIKVNVNLGTSADSSDLNTELEKVKISHELEADALMDLSTAGDLSEIRHSISKASKIPLGTVPAYEAFETARRRDGTFMDLKASDLFDVIKKNGEQGVDFITVHVGVTRHSVQRLENDKRIMGIVSRGGSLLASWMRKYKQENPLYERYDELLDIAAEYDMTLSLGDAMRPGCTDDATDRGQVEELVMLGELANRAYQRGVQVMIEGPGHVPLDQIEANIKIQKTLCNGAPFYVLGPIVCDVAPGYDHITAAIGGSIAAMNGADFLCYVTPGEHLRLPTLDDVREGIIASKIAGFSADLARGLPYAKERNTQMAWARRRLEWDKMYELSINPHKAKEFHTSIDRTSDSETCTMCGDFCAIKVSDNALK